MLAPEFIEHLPDNIVKLYADLEIRILEDMARRISKAGKLTETAQWQMWRLEQIVKEREFILYHLQRLTGKTQGEVNALLQEAGEEALYYDDQIYRAAGLSPAEIQGSLKLQQEIRAGMEKTMQLFQNLTSTTANTATLQFENAPGRGLYGHRFRRILLSGRNQKRCKRPCQGWYRRDNISHRT